MDCIVDGVAKSRTQLSDFNSLTCIFTLFWKGRERGSCLVGWPPSQEVQQPWARPGSLFTLLSFSAQQEVNL